MKNGELLFLALLLHFGLAGNSQAASPSPKNCAQAAAKLRPDENLSPAEQENSLLEAVKVCPDLAELHANLGIFALRKGNYPEARTRFEKANEIREDAAFLAGLGAVETAEKKFSEAEKYYERAIALDRNCSQAIQGLASVLIQRDEIAEAEQLLRRAAQLTPEDPALFYNFGIVLARQGKLTEAISSLRAALERKPDYPEAREQLTQCFLKENRFDEAEQLLRTAVVHNEKDVLAAVMLAAVLEARGRIKPAEKTLLAAEAMSKNGSPEAPLLELATAVLRIKRGKVEEGIALLERLQLEQSVPIVSKVGDASSDTSGQQIPQAKLLSALGWAYLQKGETIKATDFLHQALLLNPKDQLAKINLEVARSLAGH